jgi:hypothetical protein
LALGSEVFEAAARKGVEGGYGGYGGSGGGGGGGSMDEAVFAVVVATKRVGPEAQSPIGLLRRLPRRLDEILADMRTTCANASLRLVGHMLETSASSSEIRGGGGGADAGLLETVGARAPADTDCGSFGGNDCGDNDCGCGATNHERADCGGGGGGGGGGGCGTANHDLGRDDDDDDDDDDDGDPVCPSEGSDPLPRGGRCAVKMSAMIAFCRAYSRAS